MAKTPKTQAPAISARPGYTVTVHPDGSMSVADCARLLGYTPQGLRGIIDRGCPVEHMGTHGRGKGTRVRLDVVHAFLRDERANQADPADDGQGYNFDRARARDMHFRSIKREAEALRELGVLIPVDVIADVVDEQHSKVKAGLLSLPARLGPRFASISDAGQIQRELRNSIDDQFNQLSEGFEVVVRSGGDPDRSIHDETELGLDDDPDEDEDDPDAA